MKSTAFARFTFISLILFGAASSGLLLIHESTIARAEQWQPKIDAVGGLNAIHGVDVSSEVPGKVSRIDFESGHEVDAGALLVQLDASAEAAQLRALRAQHALTKLDFERAQGLAKSSAISQAQ